MTTSRRSGNLVLWASLAASLAIVSLTVAALRIAPGPLPPPGALPRMRGPADPLGPGTLLRTLGIGSLTWYVSILAAPFLVWLSGRFPFERGRWRVSAAVLAVVILGLALGTALLQHRLAYGDALVAPPLSVYLRAALLTGLLPFLAVAALAQALDARTREHARALDAVEARNQLTIARLEALTARLQPHFLFNTLQGISTLIHADPDAADRMLTRLSDLLREVLARGAEREVLLDDELRVLSAYLDIARMRFGDRLAVAVEAAPATRIGLVPFFVLQPLVENALRHGVERRAGPAIVRIRAAREKGRLVLTVEDDGLGDQEGDAREGSGLGLATTRARLGELYGDAAALEHGARLDGGYAVQITLPWRAAPTPVGV
jgi:hypothetical protein